MTDCAVTPAAPLVAPDPVARPLLAAFMWARRVKLRQAGEALGVSHEQVRLYCLPFGDPRRAVPDLDTARRISTWSGGIVQPWTFEDTPGARAIALPGGIAFTGGSAS